eukprot:1144009-Pyramimonas_sp.AAC.1
MPRRGVDCAGAPARSKIRSAARFDAGSSAGGEGELVDCKRGVEPHVPSLSPVAKTMRSTGRITRA